MKDKKIFIIFTIFFILVLIEHQFIWMYHDDYGYASLSYAVNIGNIGINYGLSSIITFIFKHYMLWGGRILSYFYECLFLKIGLYSIRLVQSIIITLIFYLIYKILEPHVKIKKEQLAILTVSMYGFLEIMLLRNSIFWFSASVSYLWPILPFLFVVYSLNNKNNKNKLFTIIQCICIFLASCSFEQIGFMTFIYLLLELLEQKFIKKENNKKIYLFLSISLIGLAIILLAPGNTVRLTSPTSNNFANISIISKLLKSIPAIINGVFDNYSNMFINLFLIVISYISIENQKNNKNKLLNLITISNLFITLFSILNHQNYFNYFISQFESHFVLALIYLGYIIQILAIIITIIIYFYQHQNNLLIKIFLTSLASLTVMLVAPYYPSRSNIPFYFLNFLIIIYILAKTLNKNQIIIIAIALIAFLNYSTITYGYFQNNHINQKNDLTLKETAQKIQNKEKITTIPIQKQKYILYSGEQPYIEGNEYIEEWLKNYYALPKEITFTYYD